MSSAPLAPLLPPVVHPDWLTALGVDVLRPVFKRMGADANLRAQCADWTAETLAGCVLAGALGSVGGLSFLSAGGTTANNVRAILARSERVNVNLNDLIIACPELLNGDRPRRLVATVPPGESEPRRPGGSTAAELGAAERAEEASRVATAVAGTLAGNGWSLDVFRTPLLGVGLVAGTADALRETVAEVVIGEAFRYLPPGAQAERVRALVALDPYRMVAPAGGQVLEFDRREFFARWDAHVRGQTADGDTWAAAEEFWTANSDPHRNPPNTRSPLRLWLRQVFFLGADTKYRGKGKIPRDLGRSLVLQLLGFEQLDAVLCKVCGQPEPAGNEVHRCGDLPPGRRTVFARGYRVVDPNKEASQRAVYATCARKRVPANLTSDTKHTLKIAQPPARPREVPVPGNESGFWVNTADPVHRSARLHFKGTKGLTAATVEVWAVLDESEPIRLASIALSPCVGATALRPTPVAEPTRPAVVELIPKRHGVTVWLLYARTLVILTRQKGRPAAGVECRVVLNGCGHRWRHDFQPDGATWVPGSCPVCGGPATGKPSYFAAGLGGVQPPATDSPPNLSPLPKPKGSIVRVEEWDEKTRTAVVAYRNGDSEVRSVPTYVEYEALLAACDL